MVTSKTHGGNALASIWDSVDLDFTLCDCRKFVELFECLVARLYSTLATMQPRTIGGNVLASLDVLLDLVSSPYPRHYIAGAWDRG